MSSDAPSVQRLAELQQLIVLLAGVERIPVLPGLDRRESDTDHSFGLALTCWYLQPKVAPELDLLEVLKLSLAHDIVEISAGDTFAHDKAAQPAKQRRERRAIEELRQDWPDFSEMADYAERHMQPSSEEEKFVKAVDKILPVLITELRGKEEWERIGITLAMEREHKRNLLVSDHVGPYYDKLLEWLDERGNIPKGENNE